MYGVDGRKNDNFSRVKSGVTGQETPNQALKSESTNIGDTSMRATVRASQFREEGGKAEFFSEDTISQQEEILMKHYQQESQELQEYQYLYDQVGAMLNAIDKDYYDPENPYSTSEIESQARGGEISPDIQPSNRMVDQSHGMGSEVNSMSSSSENLDSSFESDAKSLKKKRFKKRRHKKKQQSQKADFLRGQIDKKGGSGG